MRRAFKTGSTRCEEPKRWFPRAGRCWCSRFAKPVQHSGATHEERLGKRNWSTGAPHLTPYVHACGGRNRWGRNSVTGRAGVDGCPGECQQDRPQEEPDGEPDQGSAQVLRGVVRQCRGRRAGRIFHRRRRLPQYPPGAGHRQGGHREHDRLVHPPLRATPRDLANAKRVTTPDVTYVSLSEDNPELKRYLPWTGTNRGPEAIVRAFEGIGRAWETKAFEVREVLVQDDKVAMFGSFTYRGRQSGQELTSPFSLLAKLRDGKIHYVQFLEDTFGTSGTLGRPRS